MHDPAEKQAYLEPLIANVHRDPVTNEDNLLFLLIALEPIRRGVSRRFVHAHGGISSADFGDRRDRTQARTIREIERQTLYDVTREAVVEAIFRYPAAARMLFPWFRAVAWRHALFQLRKDLTDARRSLSAAEAEALQLALADLEMPSRRRCENGRAWEVAAEFRLRSVYGTVERSISGRRETGMQRRDRPATARPGRGDPGPVLPGSDAPARAARTAPQHDLQQQRKARGTWRTTTASIWRYSGSGSSATRRVPTRSPPAIRTGGYPTADGSS